MQLNFSNVNTLWSSVIVETLTRLGLQYCIISPGSRSTPLTIAFATNKQINCIPILDERSASFFALGIAKKTKKPVALICTSGTAGANFYPAIIEAKYSYIPLLIFTCDRPQNLRNCHAGQTIDQIKLYGNYPQWQVELSLPSSKINDLFYLKQNIIYGWEKTLYPFSGVVHFNVPFDEPLVPISLNKFTLESQTQITENLFNNSDLNYHQVSTIYQDIFDYLQQWKNYKKGIIIVGIDKIESDILYCELIAKLSQWLEFPVFGEALSPIRNYKNINEDLIINYDLILRHDTEKNKKNLIPEIVILFGEYPTSKTLRNWLNNHKILTYILTENDGNLDALHTHSIHLRINHKFLHTFLNKLKINSNTNKNTYYQKWREIEQKIKLLVNEKMSKEKNLFEGKISWILSQYLPQKTPVVIANSMSVRYAEFFWQQNNNNLQIYFSRGANGIDGTLSTALGIAYENQPTILLTGDLAFLHDTNGLLINQKFKGSLTVILVNNNGGGIFEMLPIANFSDIFEDYFATPQQVNFQSLSNTYNVDYRLINTWEELIVLLKNLPQKGINIWEIKTNRKYDVNLLKKYI